MSQSETLTSGVAITTVYDASHNAATVMIPDTTGSGKIFARLRATLPSTCTGTISGSSISTPFAVQKGAATSTR